MLSRHREVRRNLKSNVVHTRGYHRSRDSRAMGSNSRSDRGGDYTYNNNKMREIKFRAWDKKEKIILFSGVLEEYNTLVFWRQGDLPEHYGFFDKDLIVMQYTGLKDKNGKEIYEGDIVFNGNKNYTVEFGQYYSDGYYEHHGWTIDDNFDSFQPERYEIMGNIYQNPELLN